MIQSVFKKENYIKAVEVKGHANYAKKGADIVCAAVSTAIIVTANALESLKVDQNVDLIVEEGYFKAIIHTKNDIVDGLFQNLEYTFDELSKQYPKYMKNLKEEE